MPVANRLKRAFMPQGKPPSVLWCLAALVMQAALFFVLFDISRLDSLPLFAFATDVPDSLIGGLYITFGSLFIRWFARMIFKIDVIIDVFITSILAAVFYALLAVAELGAIGGFISIKIGTYLLEMYAIPAIIFSLIVSLHFCNKPHMNARSAAKDGQAKDVGDNAWHEASQPRPPAIEKRVVDPARCFCVFMAQIAWFFMIFRAPAIGFVGKIIELLSESLIAGVPLFFINAFFRWLAEVPTGNDAGACIFISLMVCEIAFGVLHLAGFGGVPYTDAWPMLLMIYGVALVLTLISLLTRRAGRKPPTQAGS
jgi:hypothetical protein